MRIQALDIFRGLCIFYMTFGHLVNWWVTHADYWLYEIIWNFGAFVGGGGFLFVSGMSAALSYRRRKEKSQSLQDSNDKVIRNEYIFRALLIFLISTIWNLVGTIYSNIPGVWTWFVIQTISVSLLIAWPFLKTSKQFRLYVCFIIWISNEFIIIWLTPYRGEPNLLGYLYSFLYNVPEQNVILGYFPFLLAGTIIGDLFHESSLKEGKEEQRDFLRKKLIKPAIIGGTILVIFGTMFEFPNFTSKETFSSHMFTFGLELLLISFLLIIKDFGKIKFKKNYSVIKYYSFYSFTIFFAHQLLYFVFPPIFNALEIWIYIIPIMVLITLLFRYIYKKSGKYASLKFYISKFATFLAEKIS
ncbi:MAG: heparan-alpha-glucosaminide N-acetyltransferase domain-containing protein [Promethearchaeota archaeon]